MANTILIKRSNTASNVPTAGELSEGELAINTNAADRKLYSKDAGGTVFEIGAAYSHPTHPGDDFSVDSGPLTGANVISDIDINVTTDTLGHVTDANGVIATRALTAGDIGAEPADADITKANETETITGTWTLDGVVTTSDYGTGGRVKDGTDVSRPIGFNVMPVYEIDANDSFDLAHNGMIWHKDAGVAVTFTCPNDATIPQGATYCVANEDTEDVTISPATGVTLIWLEAGATPASGSFTISEGGIVTVYKYSDTEWWAWGSKESGGGASLSGLSDTAITSPADASLLLYDTGTGDWRDAAMSGDATITDTGVITVNNVAAANVAAGSLVSGVNPYITGSGTSSAFQVLFGNTTSGTSGNAALYKDSAASQFTYNPSTNTFFATNVTGTNIGGITSTNLLDKSATETVSGTWTFSGTKTTMNQLFINESASADADVTGDGQFWVKNNAPNDPYYTTDNGLDYPLAYARYRVTTDTTLDGANVSETLGVQHINGVWYSDNATAYTLTLQSSSVTTFPVGAQMTIWNEGSGTLTINEGASTTLYVMTGSARTDSAGGCTMGTGGYATLIRKSTTVYLIMGAGITP